MNSNILRLPSRHQPNDKVMFNFNSPIGGSIWTEAIVDAVTFDNHGKVFYDLMIPITPDSDTFIEGVDSCFVDEHPYNCSTNTPEVKEFIELSSLPAVTDGIDIQKLTKPKWQSLTSSEGGETLS
jgi:hypothetical protein